MKQMHVTVLATNSEGAPEFFFYHGEFTNTEVEEGHHYDAALSAAEEAGYQAPMMAFDQTDPASRQVISHVERMAPGIVASIWQPDDLNGVMPDASAEEKADALANHRNALKGRLAEAGSEYITIQVP